MHIEINKKEIKLAYERKISKISPVVFPFAGSSSEELKAKKTKRSVEE